MAAASKAVLHPRNRHQGRYDFRALAAVCPELKPFIVLSPAGTETIDFARPEAVLQLNAALLRLYYGLEQWRIPSGYLCPPIPGRADYIHTIADLLGTGPGGNALRILDIGTGANCIYPIIGHFEYGWSFVGTDIDPVALAAAETIVGSNRRLKEHVVLRKQASPSEIFTGIILPGETFAAVICNPPFHSSPEEALDATGRKLRNLGLAPKNRRESRNAPQAVSPVLNFGGQGAELWCPGGEVDFIRRMIRASAKIADRVLWFTSLVSKEAHLPVLYQALERAQPRPLDVRTLELSQGQKKSRILAWTFSRP